MPVATRAALASEASGQRGHFTSARRRAVGVITTTAGGATMVVDPLASRGVTIEPASAATLARLAAAGIEVKPARMVDLTVAGARYDTVKATLDILLSAPEFDLVLVVLGSSARAQPEVTVRPIIESVDAGKPLAAFFAPDAPAALAMLSKAGVPSFHTPEACADAIAAALARRAPRMVSARTAARAAADGRMLDELEAGALIDRLGIARAPSVALDAGITAAPALPFAYPVAVKVLSAEIAHKTDVGGVVLGVRDGEALHCGDPKNPRGGRRAPAAALASTACWCSRWWPASARCWSATASIATSDRW